MNQDEKKIKSFGEFVVGLGTSVSHLGGYIGIDVRTTHVGFYPEPLDLNCYIPLERVDFDTSTLLAQLRQGIADEPEPDAPPKEKARKRSRQDVENHRRVTRGGKWKRF